MEKHINVVASLHIGLGIFTIILGLIAYVALYFAGNMSGDSEAQFVLSIIANIIIIFFVILCIPGIIAGIGLFKRKEWARILTLIISVLDLFNFPFGTAVGVYSIWALVQPETVEAFKK